MRKCWGISGVLIAATMFTGMLPAQEEEQTVYTQVGLWNVARGKRAEFVRFVETHQAPVMRRLLDEGVIIEWGFDSAGLHSPDGYSHSTYFSAHSVANLEKVIDAYYESLGDRAEELEAELAGLITRHQDLQHWSSSFETRPVSLTKGYWFGSSWRVKRGRGADYRRVWETQTKPVYDQLLADGTIVTYVQSWSYLHTDEDSLGRVWIWHLVENLEDEAKVEAAFEAAREKLSEAEREARRDYFWSLIHEGSHRDDFTRVIHYGTR